MDAYRLLFVDDEEEILEVLMDLFKDEENLQIITATSGKEALEKIESHPIDLVLCDLKLPDVSGLDLLSTIKGKYPDSVAILATGYLDVYGDQVREHEGDIHKFITKPWDIFELKDMILSMLKNKGRSDGEG